MRTTLTLEDDVAALLRKVQKQRKASMKEAVNTALRAGLIAISKLPGPQTTFLTQTLIARPRLLPNVDDISEVLALIEGDDFK
jgi:hypothetical protein